MGCDVHFDQRIAGRAAAKAGAALASEPQHLTVFDPGRYRDVEPFLGGERQPLLSASRRRDEIDGQREMPVAAARSDPRSGLAASPAAGRAEGGEQILEVAQIHLAVGPVSPPLSAFRLTSIIAARRALGAGFVDFTPIVPRPLVGIREQVVGCRDFFERRFRFGFSRIDVGMKLLGELAIGFADLVRTSVRFDAEQLIGCLRHPRCLVRTRCAVVVAFSMRTVTLRSAPPRSTVSSTSSPIRDNPTRLRSSVPLRIGAPLIATTRSLVRSPARSAGEPGSTRAITAPCVCLVPSAWARSGVRSWIATPMRPRLISP